MSKEFIKRERSHARLELKGEIDMAIIYVHRCARWMLTMAKQTAYGGKQHWYNKSFLYSWCSICKSHRSLQLRFYSV